MSLVKLKTKSQVTIPEAIKRQLGMQVGDLLEATVEKGRIVLKPQSVVDRDEYTAAQRRRIDAQLAKSMAEYKEGKYYGPFNTPTEAVEFLHQQVKKSRPKARKSAKRRAR